MNHKRISRLTHCLAIISIVLTLALQNTAALPQLSSVQPVSAASNQPGIPGDWLVQAQENIRQSEYNLSWTDQPLIPGAPAGYQAPNRAQDLRFYFQTGGLQVIRRTENEPTWVWGMALSGVGRGEQLAAIDQPALNVAGNQIIYQRAALFEMYTNSELGLQQTLHLETRPGKSQEPLTLRLQITGDLSAHAQVGGGFEFRQHGLAVLSYGNLQAQDTNGKSLPVEAHIAASLDPAGGPVVELELAIDDQHADYPLSIQAVLVGFDTSPAWYDVGVQADAMFGACVATAGDVNGDGNSDILVGIPNYDNTFTDQGAAFLYFGAPAGPSNMPDWIAFGISASDKFGSSVATAGDVNRDGFSDIIIGAPGVWNLSGSDTGAVYVYHGSFSGPGASPDWTQGSPQVHAQYGFSV
ncbi:MAG: FG-GAP repeat protein, partial [Anaerolineales bacterium]|nr:FG-GAP repeat protein [Anaerolineales bacterium]